MYIFEILKQVKKFVKVNDISDISLLTIRDCTLLSFKYIRYS